MGNKRDIKLYISMIAISILFLLTSIFIVNLKFDIAVEIQYVADNSNSLNNRISEIYWDYGEGYFSDEKGVVSSVIRKKLAIFQSTEQINDLKGVRFDFINTDETVKIDKISIRNGAFITREFLPSEIYDNAIFYNVEDVVVTDEILIINPLNEDSQCIMNEWFVNAYTRAVQKYEYISNIALLTFNIIIWAVIMGVVLKKKIVLSDTKEKIYIAGCIIVGVFFVLILFMAAFSKTYGHPDEDVTRHAIDYYLKYWGLPDFNTKEAANSFSNYGSTRLGEKTIYYFLAGKIGWILKNIFHISVYYRAFNVLLYFILFMMFLKFGKKCPWMVVGLVFSPQLLYIFSYATSDAWDYFLGYLLVFNILNNESRFNKALNSEKIWRYLDGIVLEGIGFGLLFLGKRNSYIVFLLCFFILLFRLLENKEYRKKLLQGYCCVVAVFVVIIGARYALDYVVYNGNKGEQISEIGEESIGDAEKESIAAGLKLKEQGVSLHEMISERGFFEKSYKSFCGFYGWMEYESGYFYYLLVFALYLKILSIHIKANWQYKEKIKIVQYIVMWVISGCLLAFAVYHSWTQDFQPQGRYLLPIILPIMSVSCFVKGKENSTKQLQYIYMLALISGYSFIKYGILNLI